jgi:beta-glucosidase
MSWADDVPAVLQVWFGGQEMGAAVVDVLFGEADPGGRLPTTIPERLEHTPAWGNFPGEHGQVRYGEGVLIGHRWYESRHLPVRYPFGHGLSYSSFDVDAPDLDRDVIDFAESDDASITVRVTVTNIGARAGTHVVQLYVAPLQPTVTRPPQELKAFGKVHLAAGASKVVSLRLGMRAFAHWDTGDNYRGSLRPQVTGERAMVESTGTGEWRVDPGLYEIRVANSSADVAHSAVVTVTEGSTHSADARGL